MIELKKLMKNRTLFYNILFLLLVFAILIFIASQKNVEVKQSKTDANSAENLIAENLAGDIKISRAEHLNPSRNFISDIYDSVKSLDSVWSETIPNKDYVRVTFEKNLTSRNDITIFPRIISGNPKVEVYEKAGDTPLQNPTKKIAEFTNLQSNQYNKIYLTNLSKSQDTFDLKIVGGSVQIDYIVDPIGFRSVGTVVIATAATSITLTAPTGVVASDIVLAVIYDAAANVAVTPPAGWTLVNQTNDVAQGMVTYWATGNVTSYVFNIGGSALNTIGLTIAYSGVDTTTPMDATAVGRVNAASTNITTPSITTVTANAMLVGFFGSSDVATAPTYTSPTLTIRQSGNFPVGDTNAAGGAATGEVAQAVAGASGAKTATASLSDISIGILVALRPIPVAGDTINPRLSILVPSTNQTNTTNINQNVNYTVSDNIAVSQIWYSNDSNTVNLSLGTGTTYFNITNLTWSQGLHTVTIYANDTSNNLNITKISFTVDTSAPSINITFPASNGTNQSKASVNVNYTISDSFTQIASVWYTNDSNTVNLSLGTGGTYFNITNLTWSQGLHTVTIYVNDTLNNVNSKKISFNVSLSASVTLQNIFSGLTVGQNVPIKASFFRQFAQGFTNTNFAQSFKVFIKNVFSGETIANSVQRAVSFFRQFIQRFTDTNFVQRIQILLRNIAQSFTDTNFVQRTQILLRNIAQGFTDTNFVQSIKTFIRNVFSGETITNSVQSIQILLRNIFQGFTDINFVQRTQILLRNIFQGFTDANFVQRTASFFRQLSQNFTDTNFAQSIKTLVRNIFSGETIANSVQRAASFFRQLSQRFTDTNFVQRIQVLLRNLFSGETISNSAQSFKVFIKNVFSGETITNSIQRTASFFRQFIQRFTDTNFVQRTQILLRNILQGFTDTNFVQRTASFFRQLSQNFTDTNFAQSIKTLVRNVFSGETIANSVQRAASFFRQLSQRFIDTNFVQSIKTLVRNVFSGETIANSVQRAASFFRNLSQTFSINNVVNRLQIILRSLFQAFSFTFNLGGLSAGNASNNSSAPITAAVSSGSSSSGGTSSSITTGVAGTTLVFPISSISPDTPAVITNITQGIGISEIQVYVNSVVSNASLLVTPYSGGRPPAVSTDAPLTNIYKYLQIGVSSSLSSALSKATIKFQVEKSWVSDNKISKDSIIFYKSEGGSSGWNKLISSYNGEDSGYYYYTVNVTSFSYFAIGGIIAQCTKNSQCASDEICWDFKCAKLFDIKILNFDSPVTLGSFFNFTYYLKGTARINGDVQVNFWIQKDGKIVASGSDTIYLGDFEEKIETAKIFLPQNIDSGPYDFYVQVVHPSYTAKSHRTVDIEVKQGVATLTPQTENIGNIILIYTLILLALLILILIFYFERKKISGTFEYEQKWIKKYKITLLSALLFIVLGLLIHFLNLIPYLENTLSVMPKIPAYVYYLAGVIILIIFSVVAAIKGGIFEEFREWNVRRKVKRFLDKKYHAGVEKSQIARRETIISSIGMKIISPIKDIFKSLLLVFKSKTDTLNVTSDKVKSIEKGEGILRRTGNEVARDLDEIYYGFLGTPRIIGRILKSSYNKLKNVGTKTTSDVETNVKTTQRGVKSKARATIDRIKNLEYEAVEELRKGGRFLKHEARFASDKLENIYHDIIKMLKTDIKKAGELSNEEISSLRNLINVRDELSQGKNLTEKTLNSIINESILLRNSINNSARRIKSGGISSLEDMGKLKSKKLPFSINRMAGNFTKWINNPFRSNIFRKKTIGQMIEKTRQIDEERKKNMQTVSDLIDKARALDEKNAKNGFNLETY